MTFNEHKVQLIDKLKDSEEFHKDDALLRVVEIFNDIENSNDLKRQKGLINRISTDSVLNWDSINMILDFTKDYSK
jgi:hypothetical protein